MNTEFYKGKRVLVTGHTGFKGTWLTKILLNAGAEVIGYSRCSKKEKSLFELSGVADKIVHVEGDIRNLELMKQVFEKWQPEIVFHLAAQPIVKEGYVNPVDTFGINVMGTVNILECVRLFPCVKSILNVTTDKVYFNNEWLWGYRENETLRGADPYSNSKSCSELITGCYKNSFFEGERVAVSTARAGNVIGGGDFAKNRIVPDCVRAATEGRTIEVRNPYSIRPYQHVIEALMLYLEIAEKQYLDRKYEGSYNVGPDECTSTGDLVDIFCKAWGEGVTWKKGDENFGHEAECLKLDCSKIKSVFGWRPCWNIEKCIEKVCEFSKIMNAGGDISAEMDKEIADFLSCEKEIRKD
ncbi:MAG: CDP-glucose 4,6-dehydratase [Lachnospiraceae bacterium]|nr:CDP-glucose 4,6-dehydratase [Lachnospiraceae bacterium]